MDRAAKMYAIAKGHGLSRALISAARVCLLKAWNTLSPKGKRARRFLDWIYCRSSITHRKMDFIILSEMRATGLNDTKRRPAGCKSRRHLQSIYYPAHYHALIFNPQSLFFKPHPTAHAIHGFNSRLLYKDISFLRALQQDYAIPLQGLRRLRLIRCSVSLPGVSMSQRSTQCSLRRELSGMVRSISGRKAVHLGKGLSAAESATQGRRDREIPLCLRAIGICGKPHRGSTIFSAETTAPNAAAFARRIPGKRPLLLLEQAPSANSARECVPRGRSRAQESAAGSDGPAVP